jgi:predicted rRNA pseudouridine synthase
MQLHEPVEEEKLRSVIREFEGTIYQKPPVRSSVKRAIRRKKINKIELLEYTGKYALLHIDCEAGTYMRKLCWDIGLILGVGAHMRELRRIRTGPFHEDRNLVRMHDVAFALIRLRDEGKDDLLRKIVLPGEFSVCHLPKIVVRDSAVESIVHGASLKIPGIAMLQNTVKKNETVAMLTLKGELIGLGVSLMNAQEIMENERGEAVKPKRIIMEPGLYPRMWKKREENR